MNYKKEYLMMKEKYLALKNQLGGFRPPQGVQQTEEQRTRREASERAAMLSVDMRLVIKEVDKVKEALRINRKPAIDMLHYDVFFHILTFLSLEELYNMFKAFNQPNSKELQKAGMLREFIKERIEKIKEYKNLKKIGYEKFLRLDNEAVEELKDIVEEQEFEDYFLMRTPSISEITQYGSKISYYYVQAQIHSPADEVTELEYQVFSNLYYIYDARSEARYPILFHRKFRINDLELKTAVKLGFIKSD